jgi:tetratricopeptide (TPR) repeat protein
VATSLSSLGTLLFAEGGYDGAEVLYERALRIREEQLGEGHPDTATASANLAAVYISQDRHAEAMTLLKAALKSRRNPADDQERALLSETLSALALCRSKVGGAG